MSEEIALETTITGAARRHGISYRSVYLAYRSGRIQGRKVGSYVLLEPQSLLHYVEAANRRKRLLGLGNSVSTQYPLNLP